MKTIQLLSLFFCISTLNALCMNHYSAHNPKEINRNKYNRTLNAKQQYKNKHPKQNNQLVAQAVATTQLKTTNNPAK